jgi:hypothetical protein
VKVKRDKAGDVKKAKPGKTKIKVNAKAPKDTKPRTDADTVTIQCLPRHGRMRVGERRVPRLGGDRRRRLEDRHRWACASGGLRRTAAASGRQHGRAHPVRQREARSYWRDAVVRISWSSGQRAPCCQLLRAMVAMVSHRATRRSRP